MLIALLQYTGEDYINSGNEDVWHLPSWQSSLIVSILSAGTFFGAVIAGDLADFIGRRTTIILGCIVVRLSDTRFRESSPWKLRQEHVLTH